MIKIEYKSVSTITDHSGSTKQGSLTATEEIIDSSGTHERHLHVGACIDAAYNQLYDN